MKRTKLIREIQGEKSVDGKKVSNEGKRTRQKNNNNNNKLEKNGETTTKKKNNKVNYFFKSKYCIGQRILVE